MSQSRQCFRATMRVFTLLATWCGNAALAADETPTSSLDPIYAHGIVAADHPLASAAGADMLRQGGNVVDAAVAASFALSVVRPESCGLGGGGFIVIWNAESRTAVALDYRERAPRAAHAGMFRPGADDAAAPDSQHGGLAAAVPGNVAGLCYALEHYGSLPLATVLAPAIALARDGVPADETFRRNQRETLGELDRIPGGRQRFAALHSHYLGGGRAAERGELFNSPLDDVLARIAVTGPDGFYGGEVGAALVAEVRRQGGLWTADDLQPATLVVERQPLHMTVGETELWTMPPPSSGGTAMIEMLQILRAMDASQPEAPLTSLGHNSPEYLHRLTEAAKHAFADRAAFLGDADFVAVPVDSLTSPDYARRLAARFDPLRTKPVAEYGRSLLPDDSGTSHLSVVDADGNAVACTETINTTYGSFVVEPQFGVILNNQMDDFTARPGEPNAFGLVQSELNAVAPGKKPLSSMTPTIVVRDGRATLAVGASGGPRIINGTLQTLLNVTRFGMTPRAAVTAPRMHHQWQPETLLLEPELVERCGPDLSRRGHILGGSGRVGVVQAVTRDERGLQGASDPRKGGRPAGW